MTEAEAHLADDHDEEHVGEEHAHEDDHSHEHEHDDGDGHTEFHAHYGFTCAAPEAVTDVTFPYFDQFENAQEIEVVYVTDQGAGTAEATRATPSIRLK
jgi:ABC-type Zn2+ transport system substrate-binding protein/surface adhesin